MKKYEVIDLAIEINHSQSTSDFNVYENKYVKIIEHVEDNKKIKYTVETKNDEWEYRVSGMNVSLCKEVKKVSKKRKNKEAENE